MFPFPRWSCKHDISHSSKLPTVWLIRSVICFLVTVLNYLTVDMIAIFQSPAHKYTNFMKKKMSKHLYSVPVYCTHSFSSPIITACYASIIFSTPALEQSLPRNLRTISSKNSNLKKISVTFFQRSPFFNDVFFFFSLRNVYFHFIQTQFVPNV